MSENGQTRDEQGRFESVSQTMTRLLRERRGFRVRVVPEPPEENKTMNELLLCATGRLPAEDPDEAA